MTHDEIRSLLDAYLDDELDLATGLAVGAHLQDCQQCSAWLAERRSMLGQVRSGELGNPPEDATAQAPGGAAGVAPVRAGWL